MVADHQAQAATARRNIFQLLPVPVASALLIGIWFGRLSDYVSHFWLSRTNSCCRGAGRTQDGKCKDTRLAVPSCAGAEFWLSLFSPRFSPLAAHEGGHPAYHPRAAKPLIYDRRLVLAASASLTKRRIASEREGLSGCSLAQSSICDLSTGGSRTAVTGS